MRFSPSSSQRPSPAATTLPFWGFSFAVSGRTMPLAVVSSSSSALTITRSPSGFNFIAYLRRFELSPSGGLALYRWECQSALPSSVRGRAPKSSVDLSRYGLDLETRSGRAARGDDELRAEQLG